MKSKYDKQYYIDRLEKNGWGRVVEDDKYYSDEDLYDSFICFYHYCFAYLNLPSPSRGQIEMACHLDNQKSHSRMLQCLRGLGKSLTAQIYVTWRFYRDADEHILVMSGTGGRAINFTSFVKKLLDLLPVCSGMRPRHNIERTSSRSFDIAGASPSDSPSLYAVGVGNQVTGFRATLIIYDDIETAQNAFSADSRAKVSAFASEADNLLITGREETITLCTPHSIDSIYVEWLATREINCMIITAEYPENIDIYGGNLAQYIIDSWSAKKIGTPIDPRYTPDFLYRKKLQGLSKYKLQYMLDTNATDLDKHPLRLDDLVVYDVDEIDAPIRITPSSMKDNQVWIKHNGFKQNKLYQPAFVSEERVEYGFRLMAIDPSGKGKDETGVVISYTANSRIFVKKITSVTGGYDMETLETIANTCALHKIDYLIIESNFGDSALAKMLEPYLARISPKTMIVNVRAKGQKEVRIIKVLEPLLNQRKIVIDKQCLEKDSENDIIKSFTYQLSRITPEPNSLQFDDKIDAFAMLCQFVVEQSEFFEVTTNKEVEAEDILSSIEKIFGGNSIHRNINYLDSF